MTIRRVDNGRNHSYIDDAGRKVPGVTTILGDGLPKPALINWAATATTDYALDHWDELCGMPVSARAKAMNSGRYAVKDAAAKKGTAVHAAAEALVHGERVTIPPGLEGHVQAYVRFLDEFDVQPVLVEKTVYSPDHGYSGTFDLVADLLDPDDLEPDPTLRNRIRFLLDLKTSRSGIFGDVALQLAAYRYAEWYMDGDDEKPMVEVDRCAAVHVRADGYSLIPLQAGDVQFRQFLYVKQVGEFVSNSRDMVGDPIEPPQTSAFRLVRENS